MNVPEVINEKMLYFNVKFSFFLKTENQDKLLWSELFTHIYLIFLNESYCSFIYPSLHTKTYQWFIFEIV